MNGYYKYLKTKELCQGDRPREKMMQHGQQTLSNAELLGLVIGSGIENMNSVDIARSILRAYDHELNDILGCSFADLQKFKGIGPAKAVLILSVLELSRRLQKNKGKRTTKLKIKGSEEIYKATKDVFVGKATEECWLVLMNVKNQLIRTIQVSKGGLSKTHVDPAVILKEVLVHNSPRFAMVHNHPSGNTEPSTADIGLTERMERAAKYSNVKLLDHLIVADDSYFSFADEGLLL